jgi:hypothetical protein
LKLSPPFNGFAYKTLLSIFLAFMGTLFPLLLRRTEKANASGPVLKKLNPSIRIAYCVFRAHLQKSIEVVSPEGSINKKAH